MGKGKKSSSKGVEMPPPKWYAVYNGGCVLTGELREIEEQSLERIKDGNKAVRGESYGVGPWHAVKVGRDCITKQAPEGATGPYLTPNITISVVELLNTIAPNGPGELREKTTFDKGAQMKMELEDVK